MAQSPEYPDLLWMPPRSWDNSNRTSVQLVVIHTTEGSAQAQSAEDGAAYDQRRTDGTSTHYFHDSNSTVQCVRTADQAHAARAQGNRRGIQHELCTRAGSANWADAYHQAMLRRAAKQAARDAKKWGIPVRHLTVAEVSAGIKGFCGHWDITRAFPQDGGTHTDPGGNFPWTQFLDLVRAELNPALEDAVAIDAADIARIADAVWAEPIEDYADPANPNRVLTARVWEGYNEGRHITTRATIKADIAALATQVEQVSAAVDALTVAGVDLDALATKVADLLYARLKD